jgi:hypothetical protein
MTFIELCKALDKIKAYEYLKGERVFLGIPDRWYDNALFRCPNGHVSHWVIRSEAKGGDCCPSCYEFMKMTFPEDKEGPLVHEALGGNILD